MNIGKEQRTIREPAHQTPVAAEVDVLVAGGGPAGLGAAIAAAREGASTLLVERNSCLGGAATAYLLHYWPQARWHLDGIAAEIVDELVRRGGASVGRIIDFDPETFKQVALDLVRDAGVKLLLYTWVVAPIVTGNTVQGAFIQNKSGRQAVLARTTLDCTGDADLAVQAGVPMTKGRESDGKMRPATLIFRMGNIDFRAIVDYARRHPDQFSPDPNYQVNDIEQGSVRISGFFDLVEQARQCGELFSDMHYLRLEGIDVERGICFVNSTRVYGVDGTDAWDLTRAEIEARDQIPMVVDFIRKYIPGCQQAFVIDTAANIGIRETRRIVGEYRLSEDDIMAGRVFEDRVARVYGRNAPGVDVHNPDGKEGSAQDSHARSIVHGERGLFVPYRSLVPQRIEGLLVAGRSISQTHDAEKWTRIEAACIKIGQAAGTAAAVAAAEDVAVREVDVSRVQQRLIAQGVPLDQPLEAPLPEPAAG